MEHETILVKVFVLTNWKFSDFIDKDVMKGAIHVEICRNS